MKRIILMLLAASACSGEASGPGLRDEEFIAVLTELRVAAQETGADTASFEARREEILARHGIREADLRAFVESPERDLRELAELWDSVGARLTPQVTEPTADTAMPERTTERREPVLDSVRTRRRPQLEAPR